MSKIAFIGAGSVVFSKQLLVDIISYPEFRDAEFALMDVDPERLAIIGKAAEAFALERNASCKIWVTADLEAALCGADYVICLIQAGGYESTKLDFSIPAKYGLRQTIADTHGVGGIFRALRTYPALDEICQTMLRVCPGALLLNYTNPMSMLSLYVLKNYSEIRYLGLCHSVQTTTKQLALYMDLPYQELDALVAGINHQAWFLRLRYRGEDCYPRLRALSERMQADWEYVPPHLYQYTGKDAWLRENFKESAADTFLTDKVRFELMNRLGYYVTESSEHNAEYCAFFLRDEETIRRYKVPVNEYLRRCEINLREFGTMKEEILTGKNLEVETSDEYAGIILHTLETGATACINGNVLNTGLITNLPKGCCVEVPCLLNGNGIQPVHIGDLPQQLAACNLPHTQVHQLTVQAGTQRRREAVYQAAMMDPLASSQLSLDSIVKICDELMEAHCGFIGQYQ